jgi:hypothetical protein
MNDPSNRMNFQQRQRAEADTAHDQRAAPKALEFATAEELLRHDAAQITVPEELSGRLAESARNEPPDQPWWKRLFNG